MRFLFNRHKSEMVSPEDALPGRERPAFAIPEKHAVLGTKMLRMVSPMLACAWRV